MFEISLFAFVGLGLEVIGTAAIDFRKDEEGQLVGYSSVWYIPFYALGPFLLFHVFHRALFALPFYVRGPLYALVFWAVEYCGMGLLRLMRGKSPSEDSYYRSRWNVHGLIRLDFGPLLIVLGFVFEWVFRHLRGL